MGIRYGGRVLKWDTVVEHKVVELSRFLTGRTERLDFSEPSPSLHRIDDLRLRERLVGLSQSDARRLGIGKGTLHYLRRNARSEGSFKVYGKIQRRLRECVSPS